jgi:hypothetical protein
MVVSGEIDKLDEIARELMPPQLELAAMYFFIIKSYS